MKSVNSRVVRSWVGLAIVFGLALYNLLAGIKTQGLHTPGDLESDGTSIYLHRFDNLRDPLQDCRIAGYIDDGQHSAGWFLAQYALAPTILAQGARYPLVVANFHADSSKEKTWVEDSLTLLRDCGNGVRLYRGVAE